MIVLGETVMTNPNNWIVIIKRIKNIIHRVRKPFFCEAIFSISSNILIRFFIDTPIKVVVMNLNRTVTVQPLTGLSRFHLRQWQPHGDRITANAFTTNLPK